MRCITLWLSTAVLLLAGCSAKPADGSAGTEVQKVRSGDLDVVLLAARPSLQRGKDTFTLEFRRAADATLADVGTVKVSASMTMAGMPPMMADAVAQPSSTPGRYTVASQLTMAGTWTLSVDWQGPAGTGQATLSAPAE